VLTAGKVRCSPSSPCSLRCAWLRVTPLLPSPSVARRGCGYPRSGRESRRLDRTGKLDFGYRCADDDVAFWIESDGGDRCPVAGLATPAPRVSFLRVLVDRVAGGEHGSILAGMTLCWRDIADSAVSMLVVIPLHETQSPLPCGLQIDEALQRELGTILCRPEQRLGEGVVIAHPRARVGVAQHLNQQVACKLLFCDS
jgi:hypothetical protein